MMLLLLFLRSGSGSRSLLRSRSTWTDTRDTLLAAVSVSFNIVFSPTTSLIKQPQQVVFSSSPFLLSQLSTQLFWFTSGRMGRVLFTARRSQHMILPGVREGGQRCASIRPRVVMVLVLT